VDESIPARDEEDADETGSGDDLGSVEVGLSSEDISGVAAGLKSNKTSLLVCSFIDKDIE
jgi:hypothetical protein